MEEISIEENKDKEKKQTEDGIFILDDENTKEKAAELEEEDDVNEIDFSPELGQAAMKKRCTRRTRVMPRKVSANKEQEDSDVEAPEEHSEKTTLLEEDLADTISVNSNDTNAHGTTAHSVENVSRKEEDSLTKDKNSFSSQSQDSSDSSTPNSVVSGVTGVNSTAPKISLRLETVDESDTRIVLEPDLIEPDVTSDDDADDLNRFPELESETDPSIENLRNFAKKRKQVFPERFLPRSALHVINEAVVRNVRKANALVNTEAEAKLEKLSFPIRVPQCVKSIPKVTASAAGDVCNNSSVSKLTWKVSGGLFEVFFFWPCGGLQECQLLHQNKNSKKKFNESAHRQGFWFGKDGM